jgi:aspartate racemase
VKTIGLIGGMSWESSQHYYRIINELVRARLGGLHSAQSLMYSVDFHDVEEMQSRGEWQRAGELLADAARRLERGGADFVVLCTNTMHKVADAIRGAVAIPLVHIADATAREIQRAGLTRVGLLGTRFTMEEEFYRGHIRDHHGLDVIVPEDDERQLVHRVIYDELCLGIERQESRARYNEIIQALIARGAQGIILGCTEIMILVKPADVSVPVFDTTTLHAAAAVELALDEAR